MAWTAYCEVPQVPSPSPNPSNIRSIGKGCMTAYEFDTTLDPDYPVLTRGNAGEIMPDIVSPLVGDGVLPAARAGLAAIVHRDVGCDGLAGVSDDVRADRRRALLHQHLGVPTTRGPDPGNQPRGHRPNPVRRRRHRTRPLRGAGRRGLCRARRAHRRDHGELPRPPSRRASPARARRCSGSAAPKAVPSRSGQFE